GIVVTQDGLLLAKDGFAGSNVVVENRTRRDEGLVLVAKVGLIELRIGAKGGGISRFGEFDAIGGLEKRGSVVFERRDAEMGQATFALVDCEMRLECSKGRKHHRGTIGNKLTPILAPRVGCADGHETKSAAEGIGSDKEDVALQAEGRMMVGVVFVIVFAG